MMYTITIQIDIEATSPTQAKRKAHDILEPLRDQKEVLDVNIRDAICWNTEPERDKAAPSYTQRGVNQ